jgi:hypothetical protein
MSPRRGSWRRSPTSAGIPGPTYCRLRAGASDVSSRSAPRTFEPSSPPRAAIRRAGHRDELGGLSRFDRAVPRSTREGDEVEMSTATNRGAKPNWEWYGRTAATAGPRSPSSAPTRAVLVRSSPIRRRCDRWSRLFDRRRARPRQLGYLRRRARMRDGHRNWGLRGSQPRP